MTFLSWHIQRADQKPLPPTTVTVDKGWVTLSCACGSSKIFGPPLFAPATLKCDSCGTEFSITASHKEETT